MTGNDHVNAYRVSYLRTRTTASTIAVNDEQSKDTTPVDIWTIGNDGCASISLLIHASDMNDAITVAIERVTGSDLRTRLKSAVLTHYGL